MKQLTPEEAWAFGFLGALGGGLFGLLCIDPWLVLKTVASVIGGTAITLLILTAYWTAEDRGVRN